MTPAFARSLRMVLLTASAALFVIAGAMLIWGENKSYGIFAVLIAAVLARLLVLDLGGWLERIADADDSGDAPPRDE